MSRDIDQERLRIQDNGISWGMSEEDASEGSGPKDEEGDEELPDYLKNVSFFMETEVFNSP